MDLTDKFPKYQGYPSVPNWYSSNITAITEPHFFLYATRQVVVVLSLRDLRFFTSFSASRDKINALAAYDNFCFTGGVDRKVRIWNILTGTLLGTYDQHKSEITALKLIRNGTVSISADKTGRIVLINPFSKPQITTHNKVKSEITCLSTTVVDGKDYVAIGYANGMIFVEEIGENLTMTTVFQLSCDNDPVQSLDWQKLPQGRSEEPKWPLLASVPKRRKVISIWTFPSQSQYTSIKLPYPPAKATDQQKQSVWVELAWSPNEYAKLYFSSYVGLIHAFDLSKQTPKPCKEKIDNHTRTVFTINWFGEGRFCITTSMDLRIVKYDLKNKMCLQMMKTQATFPYALDTPSWNEGQIAVGMGDNSIKVWNFSNAASIMKKKKYHDYYSAAIFWKGLQGKIEQIRWHPIREGFIAYGNEYGHVGIYDTFNCKHIPFKGYHLAQCAPFIDWGGDMAIALEEPGMNDTLLSIGGDGIIHVYDINDPREAPVNLNDRLKEKNEQWFVILEARDTVRTILKVDSSYKFVAIGHKDGLLEVYNLSTLKVVFATSYQRQKIQVLDWKIAGDGKILLAAGCDEGIIAIYDIGSIDLTNLPAVPVDQNEPVYVLRGHTKGISALKWSRHTDCLVLAAGDQNSFVVAWDVINQAPMSLFDKHRGQILSVSWSRLDKNTIFSSSVDRFVYEWSHLDFLCSDPSGRVPLHDQELLKLNNTPQDLKRKADDSDKQSVTSQEPKKKKSSKNKGAVTKGLSIWEESENSTSSTQKEQYCLHLANRILNGKVEEAIQTLKDTSLSPEHLQDSAVASYTNLFVNDDAQQESRRGIHDLLYGDKNDIRRLVELEINAIEQQESSLSGDVVLTIQNDIKQNVDTKLALDIIQSQFKMFGERSLDSTTNSCLSDWIILAFSPMVGKQKWIELMLKQAQKLEAIKQFHLAASCYVASSRIYDAIELYRRHHMFREAIVLAKLRLPTQDPIVPSLFGDWAKELQKGTQYTLTATCYLLSDLPGSTNNAIGALGRSGEESALFSAACLAAATGDVTKDQRIELWLNKLRTRLP